MQILSKLVGPQNVTPVKNGLKGFGIGAVLTAATVLGVNSYNNYQTKLEQKKEQEMMDNLIAEYDTCSSEDRQKINEAYEAMVLAHPYAECVDDGIRHFCPKNHNDSIAAACFCYKPNYALNNLIKFHHDLRCSLNELQKQIKESQK